MCPRSSLCLPLAYNVICLFTGIPNENTLLLAVSHVESHSIIGSESAYSLNSPCILIQLFRFLCCVPGNDSHSMQNQNQNASTMGKTFTGNEMFDGKMVGSFKC